ncbi:hypothetical protein Tco_1173208 [Tanacetum coccineum]
METSRPASLHEQNLCGTQLVIVVVIDKSPGSTSIKPRTTGISLILVSSTLAFIRAYSCSPKYVSHELEISRHLPTYISMLTKEIGRSYRIDDEVVQDQRQRDYNDLQDERQDQPKEEEVKPRRSKRARIEKSVGPDFVSFMVENEPTSY